MNRHPPSNLFEDGRWIFNVIGLIVFATVVAAITSLMWAMLW